MLSLSQKLIVLVLFQNTTLKQSKVTADGNNWHLIELGPFDLQNESELEFVFKDIDNPCWKKGMMWDFIELRLVTPGKPLSIDNKEI